MHTDSRILVFNASPHAAGHTASLLLPAAEVVSAQPGFSVQHASLAGRRVQPCQGCYERCAAEGRCWIGDDFEDLAAAWRAADGVLLGAPVFTYGPPSTLYAFFQRLQAVPQRGQRRLPVPIGLVAQGGAEYSGAELTAQALLSLSLAAGCTPVAGDMPGCGQGVIGQVRDRDPEVERLAGAAMRLAVRVCELVKILDRGSQTGTVRLLVVQNGRAPAGREALLKGAHDVPGVKVEIDAFDFGDAAAAPCQACTEYCSQNGECVVVDGMQTFRDRWLQADAVAWLAEPSSVGASPALRATFDRMNELRFERHFGLGQGSHMARYVKATAIFGSSGNPEARAASAQFLRSAALLYQCVILPGFGWHQPATSALGRRLVGLAGTLKNGLAALAGELPDEYYPSRVSLGQIEPERAARTAKG